MVLKFKEYLTEAARRSLSRVMQNMAGRSFGVISAHRDFSDHDAGGDGHTLSAHELNQRHAELKNSIKAAGFSYIPTKGHYVNPEGHPVHERSLVVFSKKKGEDGGLHKFLMDHGQKYAQDSIIHQHHDASEPSLHYTMNRGGVKVGDNFTLGRLRPGREGHFGHTKLKNGKTFAFSGGKEVASKEKSDHDADVWRTHP
jgi:hypothetical protein